jgi:polyisoprenyl-teichoic acid--peptidoglycan teichoic acid transferase
MEQILGSLSTYYHYADRGNRVDCGRCRTVSFVPDEYSLHAELAGALAVPGLTLVQRRRWLGWALLVAGVGAPIGLLVWSLIRGGSRLSTLLDGRFHLAVIVTCLLLIASRWFAVAEVVRRHREAPHRVRAGVVAVAVPVGFVVAGAADARSTLDDVFVEGDSEPIFDLSAFDEPADSTTTSTPTSTTAVTSAAPSTIPVATGPVVTLAPPTTLGATTTSIPLPPIDKTPLASVRTVLLLGGDAGPGRTGLRTDSMILLSVDQLSGRAGLISISRDLLRLRFPPGTPLADRYPDGFPELANAVYPIVSRDDRLRAYYGRGDRSPGMVATAQAIGYSLGVSIDDVALVNMQGFLELIDALGGVTVRLPGALSMPGNVPGAKHELPETLGPGTITMDGTTALGYVRSRHDDSDYQRMRRQRVLLAALGSQISMTDIVLRFSAVTEALGNALRTTMTSDEFAELIATIGDQVAIVESVGLVPPLVKPSRPDYARIDRIVAEVMLAIVSGQPSGY